MKLRKKIFVSVVLVLAIFMLNSSPVFSAEVNSVDTATTENVSEVSVSVTTNAANDIATLDIYSLNKNECMISEYVNAKDFNEASHIERLNNEEKLDTYVFLNADGTKSVYYMDEKVKFVDKNGNVQEKDVSLVSKSNGYGITRNEFDLHLPTAASSGISMSYEGYDVKIIPQTSVKAVPAKIENGSVVYDGFFGTNTSLNYTPILSGLKEDVIMKAYIPNATFSFILDTDGLGLYNNKGEYYLAENKSAKAVLHLGKVIIYDAMGKPEYGTMTVTTIAEGQKYKLSLSAPEEFLADPTTVYPVTIDPTLTVSDNTTGNGAIQDAVLYSNRPDINYGGARYLSLGYVDSTYGVGRIAVKLPGLYNSAEYINIDSSCITSVKFYCWDNSDNPAQQVNLYRLATPWGEEAVNGGMSMPYYTTPNMGTTMSSDTWTAFDITALVKTWKTVALAPPGLGFILVNSNESSSANMKKICSSEFSNPDLRPYVVMTYTTDGVDFANARTLTLNTTNSVEINKSGQKRYFKFSPPADGFYTFESSTNSGDPYAWLYNSGKLQLVDNDDDAGNANFRLTYHLSGGRTYYFVAGHYYNETVNYNVVLTQTVNLSYMDVNSTINWGDSETVDVNRSKSALVYKFTPSTSAKYLFYTVKTSGDPKIWLYDSNLSHLISNDDGAGNSNARITYQLVAGHTYYIVAGHYGTQIGTYEINILLSANISNGMHLLKNVDSSKYMDIDGPGAQEWVHQWTFHTGAQVRWIFQKQSDGSYTIKSEYGQKKYIGTENGTIGTDNIKLYSSISNNTKWNIYTNPSGDLFLEPINHLGKVLYAPNNSTNTELQLEWLSYSSSERHKWRFEVVSDTPVEGQQMSMWCWVTSARMLSMHYYDTISRTQSEAVIDVKGSLVNGGGWEYEAVDAALFYCDNVSEEQLDLRYCISNGSSSCRIFSEATLRQFLDDGHVVYIARSWYNDNNVRTGGHAYVVSGYKTYSENGEIRYKYVILDPWPAGNPQPGETTPVVTTGKTLIRSYEWICNGRTVTSAEGSDTGIWEGYVVVNTSYSANTISPVYS